MTTTAFHGLSGRRQTDHWARRAGIAAVALASVVLAGCETQNALTAGAAPQTQLAPAPQPPPPLAKVAIAPIIGAPDQIGRQLLQDVSSAVGAQRVAIVPAGEKSDFTLRGYVVAAKDKANTKVSYIWDVTDPTGKRVNRITGEEIIANQAPKDPWSAVSPQVTLAIAQKSANSFGTWLPTATGGTPVAANNVQPTGIGAGTAPGVAPVQTASTPPTVSPPAGRPAATTVSAPAGSVLAMVPAVVGAPGDGATSLTSAIQSELTKSGVTLSPQPMANSYRVEGVVKVGASREGKQPIQIDWNVRDPQGNRLGTVTQKNEIAEGSLDGQWGKVADAAAAAAAQGILKLLPRQQ